MGDEEAGWLRLVEQLPNTIFSDEGGVITLDDLPDSVKNEDYIVVNGKGGKQSHVPHRMDLLPALAALEVGRVLHAGAAKYGTNNWMLISPSEHLNHALTHAYKWLAGDRSENHFGNFACRAMMALHMELLEQLRAQEVGQHRLQQHRS